MAIALNHAARQEDEWFEEPDDLDRLRRALAAIDDIEIVNVGETEFIRAAVELAQAQLREGLPLGAELNVVGYLARKPEGADSK